MNFTKTLLQCIKETKNILVDGYHNSKKIHYKGNIDLVTPVYNTVENKVISIIHDNYPSHDILTEEMGKKTKPLGCCYIHIIN